MANTGRANGARPSTAAALVMKAMTMTTTDEVGIAPSRGPKAEQRRKSHRSPMLGCERAVREGSKDPIVRVKGP